MIRCNVIENKHFWKGAKRISHSQLKRNNKSSLCVCVCVCILHASEMFIVCAVCWAFHLLLFGPVQVDTKKRDQNRHSILLWFVLLFFQISAIFHSLPLCFFRFTFIFSFLSLPNHKNLLLWMITLNTRT